MSCLLAAIPPLTLLQLRSCPDMDFSGKMLMISQVEIAEPNYQKDKK